MTEQVDPNEIEAIVGARRHATRHLARGAHDGRIYILHSAECVEAYPDLRECPHSRALDDHDTMLATSRMWSRRWGIPVDVKLVTVAGRVHLVPEVLTAAWAARLGVELIGV